MLRADLDGGLGLGLDKGDHVGDGARGAHAALGVVGAHDLDLDAEHTLAEEDVADSVVDVVDGGLTRVEEEAVGELHRLGTGGTELARDNDLATLSTRLHNVAEDTVASTAHGKATEELVAERLGLGNGRKTTVLDLLGVELERVLGELETLLNESLELTDAAALVAEDLLGVGGTDDDLGAGVGDADLAARVALLSELAHEELAELGLEDTVGNELALLRTYLFYHHRWGATHKHHYQYSGCAFHLFEFHR